MQMFSFASYFAFGTSQFAVKNVRVWLIQARKERERVVALNNQISSVYLCTFFILRRPFFSMQSGALGVMPITTHVTVASEK